MDFNLAARTAVFNRRQHRHRTGPSSARWPILGCGRLRAVLLLENRLLRGAFTVKRLGAVTWVAGQLAVSLDNAQVYADFRRVADEQAALRRLATSVARGAPAADVFATVTAEAARLLQADGTMLLRFDPDDALTVVASWRWPGAA